jgi:hypothetical protein
MFDNTKPNVILLTDFSNVITMEKTLGSYRVASQLRHTGFEVAVIHHLSTFSVGEIKHTLSHMISDKTLFIGVSNYFYFNCNDIVVHDDQSLQPFARMQAGSFLPHGHQHNHEIKDLAKSINPKCKFVLGGPDALDMQANRDFDYVVQGYADISAVNLAQHLLDPTVSLQKSYRSIFGFHFVDDAKAESFDFVTATMKYEDHDAILPGETLPIEIARGCIFSCSFCSYPLNGKKKLDFIRSVDNLYAEMISNYEKFGTTRYFLSDDTLNDSVEKCQLMYELGQRLPFKLEYWAYIRLDLLTAKPDTIDLLWKSGWRAALFGIESLDAKAAAAIGKGGSREKLIGTLKELKRRYGDEICLTGSFIYGLPHESIASLERTTKWLLSDDCPLDAILINTLRIRSPELTKGKGSGFVSDLDRNWAKYGYTDLGTRDNRLEAGTMVWQNEHTTFEYLTDWVAQIHHQVHDQYSKKGRLLGRESFSIAGLTGKLKLNQSMADINYYKLDQRKLKRARLYKEKLWAGCSVPLLHDESADFHTFGDWLKQRK